jgi:hypothetical protein
MSQQLRQAGYYERSIALHPTPKEVDDVKPAKEKHISRTKRNTIHYSCQPTKLGI